MEHRQEELITEYLLDIGDTEFKIEKEKIGNKTYRVTATWQVKESQLIDWTESVEVTND